MDPVLYKAVVEGKVEDYHEALRHHVALRQMPEGLRRRQVTPNGNTVLHVAAIHGHTHFVEEILEEENVHRAAMSMLFARNKRNETVLHCAAEKGYDGFVSDLFTAIKKYEDLESADAGVKDMIAMTDNVKDTALHKAVRMGYLKVVELLVTEDIEFEYPANEDGETPIYIAAESKFQDCLVEMLNTCNKPTYGGPLGRNALHGVILSGISDGALSPREKLMLSYDSSHVDTTGIYDGAISPVGGLIQAMVSFLERLLGGSIQAMVSFLERLLGNGDVSDRDDNTARRQLRKSTLILNFTQRPLSGLINILILALVAKVSRGIRRYDVDRRDMVGDSAISPWRRLMLFLKSSFGRDVDTTVYISECTRLLLEKDISLCEKTDNFGWTPLHYAVKLCDNETARMILEAKRSAAYIRAGKGNEWTTIFHIAAREGNIKMMKYISNSCPDCWEMTNSKLQNVFHEAVLNNRENVIRYILKSPHIDNLIDEKDEDGNTPLHLLAISDCHNLQSTIKRHKRKHLVFNKQQQTPFDMALEERHSDFLYDIFRQGGKLVRSENKVGRRGDLTKHPTKVGRSGDLTKHQKKKKKGGDKKEKEINNMLQSSKTNIIVATLTLTVTFAAGFTVPGGYDGNPGSKQGKPILLRNAAFIIFVVADTIAFICSILSIFLYIVMARVASSSSRNYRTIFKLYQLEMGMTYYATVGVVAAFVSGVYATLSSLIGLAIGVIVICVVIPLEVDIAFSSDQGF